MSTATSKQKAIADFRLALSDATKEVTHLASDDVWGKMVAKLTAGYAARNNDAEANMFLFRVEHRRVYVDKGYPKLMDFYQFLSGDPDATEKQLRNHFGNRRQLGMEMWGAVEGKGGKVSKPAVETLAIYLSGIPAKLASAVATPDQSTALADAIRKANDAVVALIIRMDAARTAAKSGGQNTDEPTLTAEQVDALLAASERRTGTNG